MNGLKRIGGNVLYSSPYHELDQPCLYAIVGKARTLMIDGGVTPALARDFVDAVRSETGRGVDFAAVTHWHWDHTFGLAGLDAPVIARRNTAEHLKRISGFASWSDAALDARLRSGEEIPMCAECIRKAYPGVLRTGIRIRMPDIIFEKTISIDLGGLVCDLVPLPPVHTNDSLAIHVPDLGLLFIGDSTGQNSYDAPAHYSAPAVLELFRIIRSYDADLIMESHAEPADPKDFQTVNGILEAAADGVLKGCHDKTGLMGYLAERFEGDLPADTGEIVDLFVNGVG